LFGGFWCIAERETDALFMGSSSVTALSEMPQRADQFWVGRPGVEKFFPVGHVSPFIRYWMSWMITQVGSS
jgi:hypothetical protein